MAERNSAQDSTVLVRPPTHPVSQLQGPFEESMLESVNDESEPDQYLDPISRRNMLLESSSYVRVVAGRWKQKPGEKYHPLWKLIAQISFGVHLLAAGMAKSEEEVMEILQSHVDEIDGFLERTTEDLDLAMEDIQERLRCLKLPLRHPEVFDRMLEDRSFRNSIVEGNEKIEHIIDRTSKNMKDSLKDVQKGFDSTTSLEQYLHSLSHSWLRETAEHEAVFVAMLGNVEGWRKAFMDLHLQGNKLGGYLKKLTEIINEMQQRAGEVSRKMLHQAHAFHKDRGSRTQQPSHSTSHTSVRPNHVSRYLSGSQNQGLKRLPTEPPKPHVRQSSSKGNSIRSETPQLIQINNRKPSTEKGDSKSGSPQSIHKTHSPQVVQVSQTTSTRVRSMIPTVMNATSTEKGTSQPESPVINERNFIPVELPAHVPEETLRAVPMSKANRLSMGLGILPSDRKMKTSSRVFSPTAALIDLLRASPKSTGMPPTPQSMSSAHGSPATSTKKDMSESGTEYFSIRPDKSSGDLSPQPLSIVGKNTVTQSSTVPSTLPRVMSPTSASTIQNRADLRRGPFNLHPPELPLGSPPVQQGNSPLLAHTSNPPKPASHTSDTDDGTLGEPGPSEAAESVSGFTSSRLMPINSRNPKRISAFAPELVTAETQPRRQNTVEALSKRQHVEAHQDDIVKRKMRSFIAEMEGSSPTISEVEACEKPAVVELEAPRQNFALPPRPTASSSKSPNIKQHTTFVASNAVAAASSKPKIEQISERAEAVSTPVTETQQPAQIPTNNGNAVSNEELAKIAQNVPLPTSPRPLSDGQPLLDGTAIASKSESGADQTNPSEPDPVQDMIEKLADSPPRSTETKTTPLEELGSSRILSTDHAAPPPPGPGGPQMVNANTADAGQFYGERKQPHIRTGSRGSIGGGQSGQIGWKAFFKGQPSPVGSNLSVRSIRRSSTDQKSVADQKTPPTPATHTPLTSPQLETQKSGEGTMMTAAGADVLWFGPKSDGMERVAVSAAKQNETQQEERPGTPTGPVEIG